jgi:alanine racemase
MAADDSAAGRPNTFDVDLAAIAHNVSALRAVLPAGTRICAAVKANAYGFGLLPVAHTLAGAGVDMLGLVDLRDAARLRADGVSCPILLYGGTVLDATAVAQASEYGLICTVGDAESLAAVERAHSHRPVEVFVEVDVGLERLGVPASQAANLIRAAARSDRVALTGVYTHMHVPAGTTLSPYLEWQFQRFQEVLNDVGRDGIPVGIAMAASSPVLFLTSGMSLAAVDVGRYVYGIVRPHGEPSLAELGLRSAFVALRSRIGFCKRPDRTAYLDLAPISIRPGMVVAVVPIGFADGMSLLNCGEALVRGRRVPVIGNLSLEHICLDVTEISDVEAGDEVIFIGRQGSAEITESEVAARRLDGLPPAGLAVAVRETVTRQYLPTEPESQSGTSQAEQADCRIG